ncbi:HTH-type transcriptional regulator CueR [Burkholderiales bacterium]|nr:MAG: MerR family DNA-binding transcriptional regulator [Burkholderiales bacterium]CAG1000688.1 HTH-type transcriptional regulator CueR [Burkholderiales bacterium]
MSPSPTSPTFSISDLAREFDLTTRTIRFYEDQGLLSPSRVGKHRVYGNRERVRIRLILRGKRLGFSLAEIKEFLDLYEATEGEKRQLEKFLTGLAERRRNLAQQREDIDAVLQEINTLETQCRAVLARQAEH